MKRGFSAAIGNEKKRGTRGSEKKTKDRHSARTEKKRPTFVLQGVEGHVKKKRPSGRDVDNDKRNGQKQCWHVGKKNSIKKK